jgi:hypothetical protein
MCRILWAFKLNPFEKLNIRFTATPEEIRKAYRKTSLMVHPDKCKHPQAQEAFESEHNQAAGTQSMPQGSVEQQRQQGLLATAAADGTTSNRHASCLSLMLLDLCRPRPAACSVQFHWSKTMLIPSTCQILFVYLQTHTPLVHARPQARTRHDV